MTNGPARVGDAGDGGGEGGHEELREAVVTLRAETEAMGMGKMRKALQSQRKWAVSEKRLRNMIRAIESGIEIDKTEDERVETVEMLSSTCMELQGTVQRQKKQLQAQRKQLTDAREQMIELQKYADAIPFDDKTLYQLYRAMYGKNSLLLSEYVYD